MTIKAMRALALMRMNAREVEHRREMQRRHNKGERIAVWMFAVLFSAFWTFLTALVLGWL